MYWKESEKHKKYRKGGVGSDRFLKETGVLKFFSLKEWLETEVIKIKHPFLKLFYKKKKKPNLKGFCF
ncbi:hypothetical protein ID0469_06880 [Helicobacter pylori]